MKTKLYHKYLKVCCKVFPKKKFTPKSYLRNLKSLLQFLMTEKNMYFA